MPAAIWLVAVLTALSGIVVAALLVETRPPTGVSPPSEPGTGSAPGS